MPVDAGLASTQPQQAALEKTPSTPLPTSTLLKYGVGQVGAQIFRDVPATLLPLFFTTMLGVPAWLGGVAILIPKFWVIICDPLVGAISDRKKLSWGRLPFLLTGAISTAIGFFILFVPPHFAKPWFYAVYIGVLYTLASTAFSIYSVPYLALASEMSGQYHERTRILTYRLVFISVALIIGIGLAQPLIFWFGGGRTGWTLMAATLAGISFISMMSCYLGMRRVPLSPAFSENVPLMTQFRLASRNRPFRILVTTHFIQQLGQAAGYSAITLMFIYVIKDVTLIFPFIMVMSVVSLSMQPVWLYVSRRLGKKTTYFVSVTGWALLTMTWFLVRPADDVLVTLPLYGPLPTQHALVLLRSVVIGVFNSGFILMSLSILTDTIEYDRRQFQTSREGIFSGVYSALEKVAFAAGPAIGGVILSLSGFKSSTGGAIGQDSGAVQGILMVFAMLPVVFVAISLFFLARLRLTEAQLDAVRFREARP